MKKPVAEALVVFPLALLLAAHGMTAILSRHVWIAPAHSAAVERFGSGAILAGLGEVCLGALIVSGWIAAQPGRKRLGIAIGSVTLLGAAAFWAGLFVSG